MMSREGGEDSPHNWLDNCKASCGEVFGGSIADFEEICFTPSEAADDAMPQMQLFWLPQLLVQLL